MKRIKLIMQILLSLALAQLLFVFLYLPNKAAVQEKLSKLPAAASLLAKEAGRTEGVMPQGELRINVLDVGHGDAVLLQSADKNVLVDVGDSREKDKLFKKLQALKVQQVDTVFITHHHQDHMGNILSVLPRLKVRRVYDSGGVNRDNAVSVKLRQILDGGGYNYKNGGKLQAGDKVQLGEGYYLEVLAPGDFLQAKDLRNINNTSLVIKLHYGQFTMLLTGDAEAPVEDALQKRLGGALKSDVLKVGHHGSRTSSYYPFISRVQPKYALISCGEYAKYHHPNAKVVGALEHLGAVVWNTHEHGSLTVTTDGESFRVSKEKQIR